MPVYTLKWLWMDNCRWVQGRIPRHNRGFIYCRFNNTQNKKGTHCCCELDELLIPVRGWRMSSLDRVSQSNPGFGWVIQLVCDWVLTGLYFSIADEEVLSFNLIEHFETNLRFTTVKSPLIKIITKLCDTEDPFHILMETINWIAQQFKNVIKGKVKAAVLKCIRRIRTEKGARRDKITAQ